MDSEILEEKACPGSTIQQKINHLCRPKIYQLKHI
jgi:hypothetical protein